MPSQPPALGKRSRELQEQFDTGDLELAFSDGRTLRLDAALLKRASSVLHDVLSTDRTSRGLDDSPRVNVRIQIPPPNPMQALLPCIVPPVASVFKFGGVPQDTATPHPTTEFLK